ncbi:MAG: hypothetical protein KA712_13475 [Myxococcales bacterium]|nr:hypothetical protein [Myxococcales bacterium]
MKKPSHKTLGDLVATTFDQALKITKDPTRAAELAAVVVQRLLRRNGQARLAARLAAVSTVH